MALGRPLGPPAGRRQIDRLLDLLAAAGFNDFREARGPLGLTQRQGAGRFTHQEADELISRLEAESDGLEPPPRTGRVRQSAAEKAVASASSEMLAAELQRRGWVVLEP